MIPSRSSSHALTIILSFTAIVLCGAVGADSKVRLHAGDWPQILGPQRSGQAIDEPPLASSWEAAKPKLLWRIPVGSGYSGAVISGGRAFLFDRQGQKERLASVDLKTGKRHWRAEWPATYAAGMEPDRGPRSVPALVGGSIMCYGAAGDLVCLDSRTGKINWQRALGKELKADGGFFGAGSSPLIVDDVVIEIVGGKEIGVVGLDLKSGETRWQATTYDASYASPIALRIDGKSLALVPTRMRTVLLEVMSGKVLSEVAFEARGPSVIAASPLPLGRNEFLMTANYNIGAALIRVNGDQLERVWKNADLLASQYNSPVLIGDTVIGVHGREDSPGPVHLRGLHAEKQQVVWEEALPGPTHLIAVGDQLLQLVVDGTLKLGAVAQGGLTQSGSFSLNQGASQPSLYRALPALSDHILVVRSTQDATHGAFEAYLLP